MAATLLPMGAFAAETDKAILPGASGISGYDSQNRYDYLYYGQWEDAPIQWRVLDDQTNTGEEGLFVLSEGCLGTGSWGNIPFDDTNPKSNAWQGSDAQAWCNTLYTEHFTAGEQGAVLATTKSDDAYDSTSTAFHPSFVAVENILNGDKVFFLSAQEAETAAYGFTDDASRVARYQNVRNGLWWLRSPLVGLAADSAGYINGGFTYYQWVASDNMARPAFNLDTDSVLFTSAAMGGKVSQGTISPIAAYTGNEWKLTLLDNTRSSFTAKATAKQGDTITISYDNAVTGANEYLSVMIADADGNYTHYGRMLHLDGTTNGASGTVNLDLSGLDLSGKTLYVFNEQYNGGANDDTKLTDYASALVPISLADPYNVWICGTQVTSDNASDVLADGGTVTYDPATHTLILNGATLNQTREDSAISVGQFDQALTIRLEGTNTISSIGLAVDSASSLIIQGTQAGNLTAQGGVRLADGATLSFTPASGTLLEVKADDAHLPGSPYDATVELDAQALQLLADATTIRVGTHVHAGGTATCHDLAVCDDCGRAYGELNPNNHVWEDTYTVDVAPTCTQAGSQSIHCQFCDATTDTQEVPALGHSFTHYEYNHDATCTQNGTETAQCDRYDATDTREKADSALAHTATKVEAKAPTCTEPGNKEYWHCPVCGLYFDDEALTQEITLEDTVLAPKGHGETELKNSKEAPVPPKGTPGTRCARTAEPCWSRAKPFPSWHTTMSTACAPPAEPLIPTPPSPLRLPPPHRHLPPPRSLASLLRPEISAI